ncbi:TPA: hypothetical protein K8M77_000339 [Clostridium perfringens]|nr:hypothetical protein [Clostridium perfringens]
MRVIKKKKVDCYVGDIVLYKDYPCLIAEEEREANPYILICLEGIKAGQVIGSYETLSRIDDVCSEILIKKDKVIISSEEGDESCPF